MGKILLAIWNGEASRHAQEKAIALAKEHDDELLLLYIVNLEFIEKTYRAVRPSVVANEMKQLGEFLLTVAQDRAEEGGVKTNTIVRHGKLQEELKIAASMEAVDLVILIQPKKGVRLSLPENLHAYAADLETELGVETLIVEENNTGK